MLYLKDGKLYGDINGKYYVLAAGVDANGTFTVETGGGVSALPSGSMPLTIDEAKRMFASVPIKAKKKGGEGDASKPIRGARNSGRK